MPILFLRKISNNGSHPSHFCSGFASTKMAGCCRRWALEKMKMSRMGQIGSLVVAFLVGLLTMAVISWPTLHDSHSTPLLKTAMQFENMSQALRLYRLDFGQYPDDTHGLAALLDTSKNSNGYMSRVPNDYWGGQYEYLLVSGHPLIWTNGSVDKYGLSVAYWVGNDVN